MAKPCFSWRYRVSYDNLLGIRRDHILQALIDQFGSNTQGQRWDLTGVWRAAHSWDGRYYSRVKIHFKSEEDLVWFKLAYEPPQV